MTGEIRFHPGKLGAFRRENFGLLESKTSSPGENEGQLQEQKDNSEGFWMGDHGETVVLLERTAS